MKDVLRLVAAAVVFGVCGLTVVQYRNRSITTGREIRRLEKEIADLNNELAALSPTVIQLSSRPTLLTSWHDGFIKMVRIPQDRIVQLSVSHGNAMRTVANVTTQ